MNQTFLGIGKTIFNSSACLVKDRFDAEIYLTERLSRKKASGEWPHAALEKICHDYPKQKWTKHYENRDVDSPQFIENILDSRFPFFDFLKNKKLIHFTKKENLNTLFETHHRAHAYSSLFLSPFKKCLIVVIDGAGNRAKYFSSDHPEYSFTSSAETQESCEERSVYSWVDQELTCVDKKWQTFKRSENHDRHFFSSGLGSFYEKVSEFIFNSKTNAGKVMGLAPFGKADLIHSPVDFLENLDWKKSYSGETKQDWESSPFQKLYQNVAASTQAYFESDLLHYLKDLKLKYPDFDNLILCGGCALNCTANMKVAQARIFENLFVTPYPGDEGISLGLAFSQWMQSHSKTWTPALQSHLTSFYGPKSSALFNEADVNRIFKGFDIVKPSDVTKSVARYLADGEIIAWFQGRSEIGPRALGHRSILANPLKSGLKDELNSKIKFRESFRPYGCIVPEHRANVYFDLPSDFKNPFMSFACPVRFDFYKPLKEVMHVDCTSRMQTLSKEQDEKVFNLLIEFGKITGLECLLNTSLNIMNEPIVESLADLKRFFESSPVNRVVAGDYLISRSN